jgi:hypothetical protein
VPTSGRPSLPEVSLTYREYDVTIWNRTVLIFWVGFERRPQCTLNNTLKKKTMGDSKITPAEAVFQTGDSLYFRRDSLGRGDLDRLVLENV